MNDNSRVSFDELNDNLPTMGDQIVAHLTNHLKRPVGLVLFVLDYTDSSGPVASTTNLEPSEYQRFIVDIADATVKGNYDHGEPQTQH